MSKMRSLVHICYWSLPDQAHVVTAHGHFDGSSITESQVIRYYLIEHIASVEDSSGLYWAEIKYQHARGKVNYLIFKSIKLGS